MKKISSGLTFLVIAAVLFLPVQSVFAASIGLQTPRGTASKLFVSGGGWTAGETVSLYTRSTAGAPVATVIASEGGAFAPTQLAIPLHTPSGPLSVIALGGTSHERQTASYYVVPFSPTITVSGNSAPGGSLAIDGQGFGAGETVIFTLDGNEVGQSSADASGSFPAGAASVPYVPSGAYQIYAVGLSSNATASEYIYISGFYPTVSPESWYVPGGTELQFSGSGFGPSEQIDIHSEGILLRTFTVNGLGEFSDQMVETPFGPERNQTYTFTGHDSGSAVDVTITLSAMHPYIALDNYYTRPGTSVAVSGAGFAANERVTVRVGSNSVETGSNSEGAIAGASIVVPMRLTGPTVNVTATGNTSGAIGSTELTLAPFYPQVTPSTWYTPRENGVTFTGTGFAPDENISIRLNGDMVGSGTADSVGDFTSAEFTVPYGATEAHFEFAGQDSRAVAEINLSLAPYYPNVTPSSWWAPVGSNIIFTGTGFAPNETVYIAFNEQSVGAGVADAKGRLTTSPVHIPVGSYYANFVLTGEESQMSSYLPITLGELMPGLQLSSYYAQGGMPITVTGGGFGTNEAVNITFDSQIFGTATTDATGNFSFAGAVPYLAPGNKVIEAQGQSSGGRATVNFTEAQVYVDLQLASYAGAPGESITFIGSGYVPGERVTITTDRGGVHSFLAEADGTFRNSGFTIPTEWRGGPLTLTIRGEQSFSTVEITYYVTGE